MAQVITRRYQSIQGVAAGQTAVISLPIGLSFHGVLIPYTGVTLAEMKELRVIANGDVIRRYVGGAELDKINQFDRRAAAAGLLNLSFERYGLIGRPGREATILGTGLPAGSGEGMDPRKITTLQIEIDIDAAAVGTPSIPYVLARQSFPRPSGDILRVVRSTYNAGAVGEFVITDLPVYGGLINRVHFMTDAIDKVRLERDNQVVFERTTAENKYHQGEGVRTDQTGMWSVDFTEYGYGSDVLNVRGVQDLRFTLTMNAATQFAAVVESIDVIRKF